MGVENDNALPGKESEMALIKACQEHDRFRFRNYS